MTGEARPADGSYRTRLAQTLVELAQVQLELERERDRRIEVEAVFDRTLGAMSDAVILVDQRGRVVRVNPAAARLRGTPEPASELPAGEVTVHEVLGPDVPATPWEVFERARSGQIRALETAVPSPAGDTPVSVSCSVVQDASGKVVGAVYAARDLTETQRLLRQLERAEARWRVLVDLGDLLSRELDPAAVLPETCRLLEEATGADVQMVLTQGPLVETVITAAGKTPVTEVGRAVERGTALWAAALERRVVHAAEVSGTFPLVSPSTSPGVGSAAVVPLVARGSELGAVLVHAREPGGVNEHAVTLVEQAARRVALGLANARLREALTHLEAQQEAARFREEMIAGVSHDMQTPLATLQGSIQALQDPRLDESSRDRLHAGMARHTAQLRRLVRQFLDFTLLEAGRSITLHIETVDVGEAVEQALGSAPRHPVHVDVPDDLPLVLGDRERLDQVLCNLLSNAVKFSPPGEPVHISATAKADGVCIVVADRGPGMRPTDLAHLFEKFHRGRHAAGTPGTGLGLYMSKALVEAQGGRISVVSRLGEGSRFVVDLPLA